MKTEICQPTWEAVARIHLAALQNACTQIGELNIENPTSASYDRYNKAADNAMKGLVEIAIKFDNLPPGFMQFGSVSQKFTEPVTIYEDEHSCIYVVTVNDDNWELHLDLHNHARSIRHTFPEDRDDVECALYEVSEFMRDWPAKITNIVGETLCRYWAEHDRI